MRKVVFTIGIILTTVCAQAQVEQPTKDTAVINRMVKILNRITTALNYSKDKTLSFKADRPFTVDQSDAIQPFVQHYVEVQMTNEKKYANDPAAMKQAVQSNRQELKKNIQTVLTEGQMNALKEYFKEQNSTTSHTPHSVGKQ